MEIYLKPQFEIVKLSAETEMFAASNYSAVREDYVYNDIFWEGPGI